MNTALQNALTALSKISTPGSELVVAKCRALMRGYDALYHDSPYVPLSVEQMYVADLVNPDTDRLSRTFRVAGKIDVLAEHKGQRILIDHKTTSKDIEKPDAPYWQQLAVEGQVSHYMLLLWHHGMKCDGALWDVMRKPTTSPKKLSKANMKVVVSLGEYCGDLVTVDNPEKWDGRETMKMYEARLAQDCTKERPERYFHRKDVPRLDSEIFEYARELWEHGQEMLHARNTKRYARNSGACNTYNRWCNFLGICSGYDTPDSGRWAEKPQVHLELPGLDGDGKDIITNSRIRCFQTCRRKHHYQYELGIERLDEEEKEALFFGSSWHHALEAWWKTFIEEEK